jgi:hypothetical protein
VIRASHFFFSISSVFLGECFTSQYETIPIETSKQFANSEPRTIRRTNMNNIRNLTVAAIIALATSGASFAQSIDRGEAVVASSSPPIVRVQTFGEASITLSKTILDFGDLSMSDQLFLNASVDVSNQFKVVFVNNANCYDITLNSANLVKDEANSTVSRANFEFKVHYARGTDSGIQVVTVTLENLQTGKQFDVSFQTVLI